jgi:hypothetical protein
MTLSKHLYTLDEVQASLLFSTTKNTPNEAVFWCKELIDSGCVSESISTLFQSWLWYSGPYRIQWLIDTWNTLRSDELSENDILLATYRLCNIPLNLRDTSLWHILVSGIHDKCPDRVTYKTPPNWKLGDDNIETCFIRAIYQGKGQTAWWIAQYVDDATIWKNLYWIVNNVYKTHKESYNICFEALKGYDQLLGYKTDEYDRIVLCMAILCVCINPSIQNRSFTPQIGEIDNLCIAHIEEMDKLSGKKGRRLYPILKGNLYGTTLRGHMKWTNNNLSTLYNIEKSFIQDRCPYWDEALEKYAYISEKAIQWKSDEEMETFYSIYFPDDIPDEWSKDEQLKSHGDGVLGPNDKCNIKKYSSNYLSKKSRLAWNKLSEVNTTLNNLYNMECNIEHIIHQYKKDKMIISDEYKKYIKPVKKIKRIIY